jgi:transposase-like protein
MEEKKNTRRRIASGERVGITDLVEDLINELMKSDRDNLLGDSLNLRANGFYKSFLKLMLGDLNLKIPRIRSGSNFRPAILPPHWE